MRKFLTPCNIAIVIALGCFSYIVVQSYYERKDTREFYQTVLDVLEQAKASNANASAILGNLPAPAIVPSVEIKEEQTARVFKPKRLSLKKRKPNPCEEVYRIERIGNYEVRSRDLKCLNAANYEEQ